MNMKGMSIALAAAIILCGGCGAKQIKQTDMEEKEIYLAGGCFWGTERFFSLVPGVIETEAGYANSNVDNPSYRQVCHGTTGAAETVRVVYNPAKVSLDTLLNLYYLTVDPTSLNRQGADAGTQYRTGIYYTDPADASIVLASLGRLREVSDAHIAIESGPLLNFYPAEEYHQDYLKKNPGGYCHIPEQLFEIARGSGERFARKSDEELRRELTPLQWEVTQNAATERPFVNEYDREFRPGIYVDITNGQPLFVSTDKYDSGCGWPAFSRPIDKSLIEERADTTHGMKRTEVRAADSGSHLGHVFGDGPADEGGLRYCINSASLRFVPLADMARLGYADFIPLVKSGK